MVFHGLWDYLLEFSETLKDLPAKYLEHPDLLEKVKTHGYEKLLGFNCETYQHLYLTHPRKLEPSLDGIFIDDLYCQLFGEERICQLLD